jgi:hypothetical protein
MFAGAIAALDVAFWSYRQMHAPVFFVISAKTGMALDFILHVACFCHEYLLLSDGKKPWGGPPRLPCLFDVILILGRGCFTLVV